MNVPRRLVVLPLATAAFAVPLAACGDSGANAGVSLPPIQTTTTLPKPSTTLDPYTYYYELKPGENLRMVADACGVPFEILVDVNEIDNPDNVPVGMVIEIPPARVINELNTSTDPADTAAPTPSCR